MREHYIEQMNRVVDAYSFDYVTNFYERTKADGLRDHGFPRLTATIGILMAHGKRLEFREKFIEMMDLCAELMPKGVHKANDFGIREIVLGLLELESAGLYEAEKINAWKQSFSGRNPYELYKAIAPSETEAFNNWAAYNAAGEQLLIYAGLADHSDFVEHQIGSQVPAFDENGMYMDPNEPILYDAAARMQLENSILFGYRGKYLETLDSYLKNAGRLTLYMQSVNGEMAYGGRSSQFLFNEAILAAVYEYEAVRYKKAGDLEKAGEFKRAAQFASGVLDTYLEREPLSHVKNRYDAQENIGCETYAHFDKYMITTASFIYCAYLFADDSIEAAPSCTPENGGYLWESSEKFHKVFANGFDYALEYDYAADPHYDCSGLGRIHRKGAPAPICLSVPVPKEPKYLLSTPNDMAMSICGGILYEGEPAFATDCEALQTVTEKTVRDDEISFTVHCDLKEKGAVDQRYRITPAGVDVTAETRQGEVFLMLPLFSFDGKKETQITASQKEITVQYLGHTCRYTTADEIVVTDATCSNRNGSYRFAYAKGRETVRVHIEIE